MTYFIDSNVVIDAIRSRNAEIICGHFEDKDFSQMKVRSRGA